jgi:hypothetical protein
MPLFGILPLVCLARMSNWAHYLCLSKTSKDLSPGDLYFLAEIIFDAYSSSCFVCCPMVDRPFTG